MNNKIIINFNDLQFIEKAIENKKIHFRDLKDLKNFISIYCNVVTESTLSNRRSRLISSGIILNSRYGLRINPQVVKKDKEEWAKQ